MYKLKKPDFTKLKEGCGNLIRKVGKRNLVIALAILLIGGAVLLNWKLFSKGDGSAGKTYYHAGETGAVGAQESGDADHVGANPDDAVDYFATTQINRQRSRDESLEVLQMIVDNKDALQESKDEALKEIGQISEDIANEANIETLVKAKGFEECVTVISAGKCSVIVRTKGLMPNQVAQIQEIVYNQAQILPENVNIIEKQA